MPLLPSCCSFSFALGGGVSFFGGIQMATHSSVLFWWDPNGNPLQCSCLENPRDWGAWWAAVHGVAWSQTCKGSGANPCIMRVSFHILELGRPLICTEIQNIESFSCLSGHFPTLRLTYSLQKTSTFVSNYFQLRASLGVQS